MSDLNNVLGFIIDMDGVIYHGNKLLPGAHDFVDWLQQNKKHFMFLTNSSERSARELSQKLKRMDLEVDETHFFTSALATADFLASQKPGGSAYVIGENGIINALYDAGYTTNDVNPDYVVVGETRAYNFEKIEKAIQLVLKGAKLIGASPDLTGPTETGIMPGTGALMAPIQLATGATPYYVGKPNPLIMRHALERVGTARTKTLIIGDRMDTDIVAGIESGFRTALMMSGVTQEKDLNKFAYRPTFAFSGIGDLLKALKNVDAKKKK